MSGNERRLIVLKRCLKALKCDFNALISRFNAFKRRLNALISRFNAFKWRLNAFKSPFNAVGRLFNGSQKIFLAKILISIYKNRTAQSFKLTTLFASCVSLCFHAVRRFSFDPEKSKIRNTKASFVRFE